MSSPMRRSRRQRKANARFSGADWDREALRRIRAASTSSGSSPSNSGVPLDASEDNDFVQPIAQPDEVSSDDDEASFPSDASSSDSLADGDDDSAPDVPQKGRRSRKAASRLPGLSSTSQYRGLKDLPKSGPNDVLYPLLFGPDPEDLEPIHHAREWWLKAQDVTLPSRSTLTAVASSYTFLTKRAEEKAEKSFQEIGGYGQANPRAQDSKLRGKEASYLNLTMQASDADLRRLYLHQLLSLIDETIAKARQYLPAGSSHSVVHGPPQAQRMSNIQTCDAAAFGVESTSTENGPHQGWLLNVGEKVQALSWAPVLGLTQFLALSTRCTPAQRETGNTPHRPYGPAFAPSAGYASSIQLWAFEPVTSNPDSYLGMNMVQPPQLALVIGTNCGDIRCLEWAPVSSLNTAVDCPRLLALLSSDSHVRIVAVDLNAPESNTVYVELETAGLDLTAPANSTTPVLITGDEPVFTSICWASSTELIVGCSNGVVYGYNILECLSSSSPQPWLCHPIHSTYVMTVAYANPMIPSMGHFLASSSAAGDLSLTDLRYPSSDTVQYARARLPSKPLVWSPFARCWLTSYEPSARNAPESSSSSIISCHHLRRFYSQSQVARLPPQRGEATALASSIHHPCILVGNAAGDVFATNYLRRVLINRPGTPARGAFLQQVCQYDWRPDDKAENTATDASNPQIRDLFHGPPVRQGISRLTFGFRPETIDLGSGHARETKKRGRRKHKAQKKAVLDDLMDDGDTDMDGRQQSLRPARKGVGTGQTANVKVPVDITAAEVIFEEEQAVTAIEWNINQRAAGWAAIGWGSGMVMVRDLSIDM